MRICKKVEIIYTDDDLWRVFGFIRAWRWYQLNNSGFSVNIGRFIIVCGEVKPNLPFADNPNLSTVDFEFEEN